MNCVFDNERPIYIQLVEQLKVEIISGKIKAGERIPSVRELALQTRVNPNTMQKALAELETHKLIYTERTNGKFVTNDKALINKIKDEMAKEKVEKYIYDMNKIGITFEESIKYLENREDKNGFVGM